MARYHRVLTALAVIGVVALTATLLTPSARPAPKPARATATLPTLRAALQQQLQQLRANPPRSRAHTPSLSVPFGGPTTCPAASSCSINPCVIFVQSGNQPVAVPMGGVQMGGVQMGTLSKHIATAPALQSPLGSQRCTRRALPQTFRAASQIQPVAVPASVPVVTATPPR